MPGASGSGRGGSGGAASARASIISESAAPPSELVHIQYSGKLSREKTFTNFTIFQSSTKVFSMHATPIMRPVFNIPQNFRHEMLPPY